MRVGALVAGAVALCFMAGVFVSDWVLGDSALPAFGMAFFVLSAGFWLAALILLFMRRADAVVIAGGVAPVVLAICWELSSG
jgi:hypothetical protein